MKAITKILLAIIVVLLLIPQQVVNPVQGCGPNSYNHQTFWHPWGNHHHQGIDIFASKGTLIHPATSLGIVVAVTHEGQFGKRNLGGNPVTVLGTHGLVYSINTLFPRFEHWVPAAQRTKKDDAYKIFYVNPVLALEGQQLW